MSEHDHPLRVAFCRLLHAANGGRIDDLGRPVFEEGVRGLCDTPYDCRTCPHMQEWLTYQARQYIITWECQMCLRHTLQVWRYLPGHYQEGPCERCGFDTPFLQVVFRQESIPPFPWPNQEDPTQ